MDTAAIAGSAMAMQTAQLQQTVAMSTLKKSLDTASDSSQALLDMMKANTQAMEKSVNPHLGNRMDVLG
ncbi:MAG: YjfB family protein [Syntrophomonas sp.]